MIPRTLHRVWLDEPIPERFEGYWRSLQELHPGWEFVTWSDSAELDWLQNRELFESFPPGPASYALRADVLRYEVLARHGGIYVDTDVEPLRSLDELLTDERPFIGWCSDQELDPAVIASPPGHPAIRDLVDGLADVRQWIRSHPKARVSPPGVTGPRYVTEHWRDREDVRRLPPVAFFPYHWSRMSEGKPPWPAESYAVHHWAAGWKAGPGRPNRVAAQGPARDSRPLATAATRDFSILVAFRDVDGTRTRLWDFIRAKLEHELPEAEIVVGTDDGEDPFHKTLAINRAARDASHDVLAIWDADTWVQPEAVRGAVGMVASDPKLWLRPYITKRKLNQAETEHVLSLGAAWDGSFPRGFGRPEKMTTFPFAPPVVLSRQAFETIGGMDERFRGWGGEDEAFGRALDKLVHRLRPGMRTTAIHLCHDRVGVSGRDLWRGQGDALGNAAVLQEYRRASNADAMRRVIDRTLEAV